MKALIINSNFQRYSLLTSSFFLLNTTAHAENLPYNFSLDSKENLPWVILLLVIVIICGAIFLQQQVNALRAALRRSNQKNSNSTFNSVLYQLKSKQIESLLSFKKKHPTPTQPLSPKPDISEEQNQNSLASSDKRSDARPNNYDTPQLGYLFLAGGTTTSSLLNQSGIWITIILLLLPILTIILLLIVKLKNAQDAHRNKALLQDAEQLAQYLRSLSEEEAKALYAPRKTALDYQLSHQELSGNQAAQDNKGLLNINQNTGLPIVAIKKKALPRPDVDPQLSKLILWYLGTATVWLLFGTSVGEYLGIKFVAPDVDQVSWLSFGRLRPVHTNAVFWGWASLGMLGLGYYIVPRVSNTKLASIKKGWIALILINAAVILGTLCLMAGINNGGGEYREYIWPVMMLFALGIIITLINFLQTVARRTTKEVYISNWYIIASIIFAIVIVLVAFLPYWQNGLGETIIQGYYMHQGVGMWFMLFTLGIVYYFLPQQLNRPIYSYSLGILAFWTQILFYTVIGTHHFVFSSIPWWLQTIAIVGSAGMAIPVIAGTTNFIMTFKGAWYKVKDSYTLPFFLVGILFYFTGSMQGTAEAFRYTNMLWHFTDFTVAHSHLTMYGIICFFLWAAIYAIIPRLTGKEAPQITVGAHFWMALLGLMFYSIPLMYGSTLRGLMWMDGKPFIDSVTLMAPYWLWRAIGGSLMWLSHLFFAYNMYKMIVKKKMVDVPETALNKLQSNPEISTVTA